MKNKYIYPVILIMYIICGLLLGCNDDPPLHYDNDSGITFEDLTGFATYNYNTNGGAGGTEQYISSYSALASFFNTRESGKLYEPVIVYIDGTITGSGMIGVKKTYNVSIIGVNNGNINGFGLNIEDSKNIVVRNITFTNASDDSINVSTSQYVWVDHNSFENGYDGLIDIKRGANYITVSWNVFQNHQKTMLLGHSADNASQDTGKLRVTYHHNWFHGTGSRHPRARFGYVHVFNNYYDGVTSYGIASTCDAEVLVEHNYFEDCTSYSIIFPEPGTDPADMLSNNPPGLVKETGNIYDNSAAPMVNDFGFAFDPLDYYSYTLDAAIDVPAVVTAAAGVGWVE